MPDQAEDPDGPGPLKTHALVDEGDHLAVTRILIDAGC